MHSALAEVEKERPADLPGARDGRLRGWLRRQSKGTLYLLVFASVVLLSLVPVLLLLINTFQLGTIGQPAGWGLDTWVKGLTDPSVPDALWTTLTLGVTREAIAMVVGVLLAWLIARTNLPGRNYFEVAFWISVFIPSLTVTLAWIFLLDDFNGIVNQWIEALPFVEESPFNVYSWWGIVWVHLMSASISIKVMLLVPAFRAIDSSLDEAARASGDTVWGSLRRITLPILMPTFLMVLVLSMLRALEAFEVEYILGAPQHIEVVSSIIYRLIQRSAPPEFGIGTVVSMTSLLIAVPFIIFQQRYGAKHSVSTVNGKFKARPIQLGRWKWVAFAFVSAVVALLTVIPVAALVIGSFQRFFGVFTIPEPWTLDNWTTILGSPFFSISFQNTIVLGVATALVAVVWFSTVAYMITRKRRRGSGALDFFAWLPSVLPGVVLGLGYLWLFLSVPFLRAIYGTVWILVLVCALGSMTLSVQYLKNGFRQLGHEMEEASRASGAGQIATLRHVILPLLSPALVVAGVLAFSSAVRATSHVALLSTSQNMPLSILQLNQTSEGGYAGAAVVGVVIFAITLVAAILMRIFGYRRLQ